MRIGTKLLALHYKQQIIYLKLIYFNSTLILAIFASMDLAYIYFSHFKKVMKLLLIYAYKFYLLTCIKFNGFGFACYNQCIVKITWLKIHI